MEIRLVVCPIDFSDFSARAYRHALSVAEHYRSRLVALHIVELWRYPSLSFAPSATAYDECNHALREQAIEHLRDFTKGAGHGETKPEIVVEHGIAADFILSYAQGHKADVIVMGTHGRRGYDRLVLGSVTNRVMRNAPCPVLIVNHVPEGSTAAGQDQGGHRLTRILFCTDFSENSE